MSNTAHAAHRKRAAHKTVPRNECAYIYEYIDIRLPAGGDCLFFTHCSTEPPSSSDPVAPFFEPQNRPVQSINSLYIRNRKRCIESLTPHESPQCVLCSESMFAHFKRKAPVIEFSALFHIPYRMQRFEDAPSLKAPFTREELSHTNKSPAPGPSGIAFSDLCNAPTISIMLDLFNLILRTNLIPTMWKRSKHTMIYKLGDRSLPSSWHPIAGQETMEKIFSGLLVDRLHSFSQRQLHDILTVWQRATAGSDGCYECNLALDMARDAPKAQQTKLHLI